MKIGHQLKKIYEGNSRVVDYEIYQIVGNKFVLDPNSMRASRFKNLEQIPDDIDVRVHFMNERTYNETVLANIPMKYDFEEMYDRPDALIMVVLVGAETFTLETLILEALNSNIGGEKINNYFSLSAELSFAVNISVHRHRELWNNLPIDIEGSTNPFIDIVNSCKSEITNILNQ